MTAPRAFRDDQDAIRFLHARGYKMTAKFGWLGPHKPTGDENAALDYLFHEWDFGDVEPAPGVEDWR